MLSGFILTSGMKHPSFTIIENHIPPLELPLLVLIFCAPSGRLQEAPASDGLGFGAEFFSFLGEKLVFFMPFLIKPKKNNRKFWSCLQTAEF